jgi:hypothetical protein
MLSRLRALFLAAGVGLFEGGNVGGVRWLLYAFVSLFVSRARENGAKTVQIGPFQKLGGERESLAVQVLLHGTKRLMRILSLARLPIPPHRRH